MLESGEVPECQELDLLRGALLDGSDLPNALRSLLLDDSLEVI